MLDPKKYLIDLNSIKPGTKVLVRADLNLSLGHERLDESIRILRTKPLIKSLIKKKAHITILTHLGRPNLGFDSIFSTGHLRSLLERVYGVKVALDARWPYVKNEPRVNNESTILLAENVRFLKGETENDPELSKLMAEGYDIYIQEAFATMHRQHASNYGIIDYVPSYIGPLFAKELEALKAIQDFECPKVAVIGGGKSSGKLQFVRKLLSEFDTILLGGQMATLFMVASDNLIGGASFDPELITEAKEILQLSENQKFANIILPKDVWVSNAGNLSLKTVPLLVDSKANLVDIGPLTIDFFREFIMQAGGVLQNGPMGIIENSRCFEGTRAILQFLSQSPAVTILGGGDTAAAIRKAGIDLYSYDFVSTGGGAMLYGITHEEIPSLKKIEACWCT